MPSPEHEALVHLFRNRPALAVELLSQVLGAAIPSHSDARVGSAERTEAKPVEYRADLVVELEADGEVVGAVVVEVQLGRDDDKKYTWPLYLASVRAELRCPVMLLVVAPDDGVFRWARLPIAMGHPGCTVEPVVIGASDVPFVDDPAWAARDPELAVLSSMAHGSEESGMPVVRAALRAVGAIDEERAKHYNHYILAALSDAVRLRLEEEMRLQNFGELTDLEKRIQARGYANAVIHVLENRGLVVSDPVRTRIHACTDEATLVDWLAKALAVSSAEELLNGGGE